MLRRRLSRRLLAAVADGRYVATATNQHAELRALPIMSAAAQHSIQAPQHQAGECGSFSAWAAALLAAGAAGLASQYAVALCEAESRQGDDAAAAADAESALRAAKSELAKSWRELDDDLHRQEAALPAGFAFPRPKVPSIGTVDGRLSVRIPVRRGADPTAVLVEVIFGVCGKDSAAVADGSMRLKVAECGAARVFHLEPEAGAASGLCVQLHFPKHAAAAAEGQSLVEFLKRGALTQRELEAIRGAMLAANRIDAAGLGMQAGQAIDGLMDGMLHDMLGSLFGGGPDFQFKIGPPEDFDDDEDVPIFKIGPPSAYGNQEDTDDSFAPSPQRQGSSSRGGSSGSFSQLQPGSRGGGKEPADVAYDYGSDEANKHAAKLQQMGCSVHPPGSAQTVDWGVLAGYDEQKAILEEGLLLALKHPEVYDEVAKATRRHPGSNRPRAVLFEGPPGCGKTTSARVIATQAAVPLVYVPLEAVASKWYGESERLLADVFKAADALDGCIIFLDEIDSLATTRSGDMHDATRKLLGVLLREMDGFTAKRSIVIGATNRRSDLDPALLSRFETSIAYPFPSEDERKEILRAYAQQLKDEELQQLAGKTAGMSGRDLRDICATTERTWASKIIKGDVMKGELPQLGTYLAAVRQSQKGQAAQKQDGRGVFENVIPPRLPAAGLAS